MLRLPPQREMEQPSTRKFRQWIRGHDLNPFPDSPALEEGLK